VTGRLPRLDGLLLLVAILALVASLPLGGGPAGWVAAVLAFGFLPGLVLARRLAPADPLVVRVGRSLFLAPLVTGLAASAALLAGLPAHPAALVTAAFTLLLATAGFLRGSPAGTPSGPWERRLAWTALLFALFLAAPLLAREWVRVRSDAVFHSAVTLEIVAHGLPPEDPYFAGFRLQYAWFYHAVLAVWTQLTRGAPASVGAAISVLWAASGWIGAYTVWRRLGRSAAEAYFAAAAVMLGLGAAFGLWLPIKAARGLLGETGGMAHLVHLLDPRPWSFDRLHEVVRIAGSPPPVIDKYLVMTAWGGAFTAFLWLLEAAASLRAQAFTPPVGRLGLTVLAVLATWLWNPALGLLAGIVLLVFSALQLVAPGPGGRGPAGTLLALWAAATVPGLLLVSASVGRSEGAAPFGLAGDALLASVLGALAGLLLAVPGFRLLDGDQRRWVGGLGLAALVAAALVSLPFPNSLDKNPYPLHAIAALVGGGWIGSLVFGGRRWLAGVLLALLLPVNLLYWGVLWVDPADAPPTPAETALHDWLRTETSPGTIVLDTPERVDVLWRVPRRQYFGRETYARQWGYDAAILAERRSVRDALQGGGEQKDAFAHLARFAEERGAPVLVLWRPADHGGAAPPYGDREPVWENGTVLVFRVDPATPSD
jgi:hypothetical protein